MKGLNTTRRAVRFTVGWKITGTDESAIAKLPETAWQAAIRQDGEVHAHAQVAELTGLDGRAALWRTVSAATRRWGCATCRPRRGMSTSAGS
ncbi:hypothetical protein [Nonomuraea sp. KM88]|uniref:hypothetical protein n=1 Tax=Nonomuraea sp. KM88 TaxID=3457427 RepID=UPI003FCC9C42